MKRRLLWWVLLIILVAGGAIVCTIRWQAWFGNPQEPQWEGDTLAYHFRTFGADTLPGFRKTDTGWIDLHTKDTLQILLLGDVHNSLSRVQYDSLHMRHRQIDCYAQLGDFVERGYFYYYQQLFHDLTGTGFDTLPLLSCPGNHEYRKGIRRTLSPMWYDVFRHPDNGPADFKGTSYYVDFPNLRFIVIDTNGLRWLHDFTRVSTWATRAIQEAGDRFVVVMMHHPVFSCGMGRQNPMIYLAFRMPLKKADLVFAGHDHNYARRLPFVNTNAATKYYLNKINAADERICSGHRMYELLTLAGDTLTMQTFLLETGELYDQVQIVHTGQQREYTDHFIGQPEIIDLPERYAGENNIKVRRFCNKKKHRQDILTNISDSIK
ncbi:MAG: metallophosphoesterase family protein [Paludibacteraceae bacterium]